MGVRKSGKLFEAWIKDDKGNSIILGTFDCKQCAHHAAQIAQRCLPANGFDCISAEAIMWARDFGVLEKLEEHLGYELKEEKAFYDDEELIEELLKGKIEARLHKKADIALKKKQYYEAHRLMRAVPLCEVKYPAVALINAVLPTQTGEGIPGISGVYFVWHLGIVVYVGQSTNMNKRARLTHGKIWATDLITWLEFPPSILNYAEAFYIGICMPHRNFGAFQEKLQRRKTDEQSTEITDDGQNRK